MGTVRLFSSVHIMPFLTYWFYPNPHSVSYTSPKAFVVLLLCFALIAGSFVLKAWRKKTKNPVTRKLSASWPTACMWFGITGLVMVVARVESISYVSMRMWWAVWVVVAGLYVFAQYRLFKARHYEPVPGKKTEDPRQEFLPKKKKRRG